MATPTTATRGLEGVHRPRAAHITMAADLAKFTALVALAAILADAAIGHALLWENDPYWTYWVTKTFLIATVFAIGTALLGTGPARGALITAVHTLVLTVYYWSLSPVGLPSHPEWLDTEHTWVTGIPVHFAVIYLGYLGALWLWQRRQLDDARSAPRGSPASGAAPTAIGREVAMTGALAALVVVLAGAAEAFALGEFQGVTWYVVRLLVAIPLLLAWRSVAGTDAAAAVGGAVILTGCSSRTRTSSDRSGFLIRRYASSAARRRARPSTG
jgi:hypothetical protein